MTSALLFSSPKNLWSEAHAAELDPKSLLLYRSNLLGSDLTVTNFGGGNTSAKLQERDPLTGQAVEVLYVKGSGGDLGSMRLDGLPPFTCTSCCSLRPYTAGSSTKMTWWHCCRIAPST